MGYCYRNTYTPCSLTLDQHCRTKGFYNCAIFLPQKTKYSTLKCLLHNIFLFSLNIFDLCLIILCAVSYVSFRCILILYCNSAYAAINVHVFKQQIFFKVCCLPQIAHHCRITIHLKYIFIFFNYLKQIAKQTHNLCVS